MSEQQAEVPADGPVIDAGFLSLPPEVQHAAEVVAAANRAAREAPAVPGVTRWRKRPVIVETILWDGTNLEAVQEFCGRRDDGQHRFLRSPGADGIAAVWNEQERCWIDCPEGHRVVRSTLSEYYPISPEAVERTYEPAGPPLTPAQCDRLRSMVDEYGQALSAVRRALDLAGRPGLRSPEDADVIKAAREALKVLEGSEEEAGNG